MHIPPECSVKIQLPSPFPPILAYDLDPGIWIFNKCSKLFRCRCLANICRHCKPEFWERQGTQVPNPPSSEGWTELEAAARKARSAGGAQLWVPWLLGLSRLSTPNASCRPSSLAPKTFPGGPFHLSRQPHRPRAASRELRMIWIHLLLLRGGQVYGGLLHKHK